MSRKVYYTECFDYSKENVDRAIDFLVENLEGFQLKLKQANKILIKPNLLMARPPEDAITTHPELLISLIKKISRPDLEIIIGDTPAGHYNTKSLKKLYSECQMDYIEQETDAKLSWNFESVRINAPKSKFKKNYDIIEIAEEVDLIINFAKLKTHCFTTLTCSTKNLYGLIPGLIKVQYHLAMPEMRKFANMLIDIENYFAEKTVNFVDGVLGMEGMGPSNGEPIESRCILAGNSSYYTDILASHVMGIDVNRVHTITEAFKRDLIDTTKINELEVIQQGIVQTFNFKLPPERKEALPFKMPKWLVGILNTMFIPRPVIDIEKCIGCKVCVDSCPPKTIEILNRKARITSYNECIKCYCCQEVCPQDAIAIHEPFFRVLFKFFKSNK